VKKKLGYSPLKTMTILYRTLMRALKAAQFTWIFVGKVSHAEEILCDPPEFSQVLTLLTAKTFRDRNRII